MNSLCLSSIANIQGLKNDGLIAKCPYAPYSALKFPEFKSALKWSPIWDEWAIGVIILEILVGSELVLAC